MLLRDARIRALAAQAALGGVLGGLVPILTLSTARNLEARGIPLRLGFLWKPASFQISETILPYSPVDPNWWAAIVGLVDTLFVSALVIALSSLLGLFIGLGGSVRSHCCVACAGSGWSWRETHLLSYY